MRVTFISHYPELYGANRSLLNLIDGLGILGVHASVICRTEGPITEELAKRGVPYLVFPFNLWLNPPQPRHRLNGMFRFLETRRSIPALKKNVATWDPDIIYTNSSATPIGALLARDLSKPHVWHIREFGMEDYGLQHDLGGSFFRYWLNKSAAIIAISNSIKTGVLGRIKGKVHVIYNGVIRAEDLSKMAVSGFSPQNMNSGFTFVIAGLIHPSKGQEEAIEALALVHKCHSDAILLIAGTGDEMYVQQLKTLARGLGVAPQVHFLGFVDDIYAVYQQADAVLMCSRFEAMGRVTAEAMAAGKPVIGYNSSGTAEIIDHEKNGLLYQDGPRELAGCMENLIQDPGLAFKLGKCALGKAREDFTIEAYARKVFVVLQSVVGSKTE